MNYLNDSGYYKEVESNYSRTFSYVSSQPARIPSPRSMLSCDKRLPPDTWNRSGSQENVFANPRSTLESSQTPYRGIHQFATPSAPGEVPVLRPSTVSSSIPVDVPQNPVVGQQRQQISELQFDNFPTTHSFSCWKMRFTNQATICSDFPSDTVLWISEVEMVDSFDELRSSRSVCGKDFPNFEMLDAKIASALNKIIPELPLQEEGQSRGTESPEGGSVPTRKTDRVHDLRLLLCHWCS